MSYEEVLLLAGGIAVVAVLYASVGHGGASGYIAVMALAGMAPATIRPIALMLNVVVAGIASLQFWRAGHFSWPLFWPFVVLAVPCAFLGGSLHLPAQAFRIVLGCILLFSTVQLLRQPPAAKPHGDPPWPAALALGAAIGLVSGLTGTGGGIFLSPLLIVLGWGTPARVAGVSAPFILLNSIAGLLGNLSATGHFPDFAIVLAVAAGAGGLLGAHLGSRRFAPIAIKRMLAVVLLIAAVKLICSV